MIFYFLKCDYAIEMVNIKYEVCCGLFICISICSFVISLAVRAVECIQIVAW